MSGQMFWGGVLLIFGLLLFGAELFVWVDRGIHRHWARPRIERITVLLEEGAHLHHILRLAKGQPMPHSPNTGRSDYEEWMDWCRLVESEGHLEPIGGGLWRDFIAAGCWTVNLPGPPDTVTTEVLNEVESRYGIVRKRLDELKESGLPKKETL